MNDDGCLILAAIEIFGGFFIMYTFHMTSGLGILLAFTFPILGLMFFGSVAESSMKNEKECAEDVELIRQRYRPRYRSERDKISSTMSSAKPVIETSLCNMEIIVAVKSYKINMTSLMDEKSRIDSQLSRIIFCHGCTTFGQPTSKKQLSFLKKHYEELVSLDEERNACESKIDRYKIELQNQDNALTEEINQSFHNLQSSEKCVTENCDLRWLFVKYPPTELAMFKYDSTPAMLQIGDFTYCLFSNVILVFDKNGIFSTAIDPSALNISVQRSRAQVNIVNGKMSYHQYVGEDSKLISQGEARAAWRYTRNDGLPDRRYSNNPRNVYRSDTYEYVELHIEVAGEKISFRLSSQKAGDAFEELSMKYVRKCNKHHNPIPDLLSLISGVCECDDDRIMVRALNGDNSKHRDADTENYFCKIIS